MDAELPEDAMVPMDPATVQRLVELLGRVTPLAARAAAIRGSIPAPDSAAARDLAWHVHGQQVWMFASLGIHAAIDHLRAWQLLVDGRKMTERSHYTLARSALEGVVTTRWVLDPLASDHERRCRMAGLQIQDYNYRAAVESELVPQGDRWPMKAGRQGDDAKMAVDRRKDFQRDMRSLGVKPVNVMGMTERFGKYSNGRWFYNILSAFAHGSQWSLLMANLGEEYRHAVVGITAVRVTSSDKLTIAAAQASTVGLLEAIVDFERYNGLPIAPVDWR